jgi:hypothetical protein
MRTITSQNAEDNGIINGQSTPTLYKGAKTFSFNVTTLEDRRCDKVLDCMTTTNSSLNTKLKRATTNHSADYRDREG